MTRLIVICEGQSEQLFVRDVLAPELARRGVFAEGWLVDKQGGGLSSARVLRFLRNTLRNPANDHVTTFFDLYRLPPDFPGVAEAAGQGDPIARAAIIERRLRATVIAAAGVRPERFLPHIQPYEFEALIFTDPARLADIEPGWLRALAHLADEVAAAPTPEHINDGAETHPSQRLARALRPPYEKVLHGPATIARIGLGRVRERCRHFGDWLTRVEALQPR